jgi:hypothetical protein
MGWADMATVAPVAERAALAAIRVDGEDPWAHYALDADCRLRVCHPVGAADLR